MGSLEHAARFPLLVAAALAAWASPIPAQPPEISLDAIADVLPATAGGIDAPRLPMNPEDAGLSIHTGSYGALRSGWALPLDRGEVVEFSLVRRAVPGAEEAGGAWSEEVEGEGSLEWSENARWSLPGGSLRRSSAGIYRLRAPYTPGVAKFAAEFERRLDAGSGGTPTANDRDTFELTLLVRDPYNPTGDGLVSGYPVGLYPDPNGPLATDFARANPDLYRPPAGFFLVTEAVRDLQISAHFRISDFMPRLERGRVLYMEFSPRLVDLLESALEHLPAKFGDPGRYNPIRILVGFQSPHHLSMLRARGVPFTPFSRYQYGDAASVIWDADGDGLLDDLNRDGLVDAEDARALADGFAEVQKLIGKFGGIGVVESPRIPDLPKTPYVDVDMRGVATRW